MKISILTTENQWFVNYALKLSELLGGIQVYTNHIDIEGNYDIVFILSYHKILDKKFLEKHKNKVVIHESKLPKGKGWAPLFWQILEGKKNIPFTMFEANTNIDDGDIIMQDSLNLTGYELNEEIREKQAHKIFDMCLEFVRNFDKYEKREKQVGISSFYKKRSFKDSQLNINKSIKDQFNLLRIVHNTDYPAFFEIDGYRYKLRIELDKTSIENKT